MKPTCRFVLVLACALAAHVRAADHTVTSSADDGGTGTLRYLVETAAVDGDRIFFDAGVSSIALNGTQITINDALTIDGGSGVTLDAGGLSRVFYIVNGASDNVLLSGLVITNGYSTLDGGGVYMDYGGRLAMSNCTVTTCTGRNGGGVRSDEGLDLYACRFVDNTSLHQGGAVSCVSAENAVVEGGLFAGNTAQTGTADTYRGGGALATGHQTGVTIGGVLFTNNHSRFQGGAVFFNPGSVGVPLQIDACTFIGNRSSSIPGATAAGQGGAISGVSGTATLTDCLFSRNVACLGAGAIQVQSRLLAFGCTFVDNAATNTAGHQAYGGAIGLRSETAADPLIVSNCVFRGNADTKTGGGAIGTYSVGKRVLCYSSLFEGNVGTKGGAIRTMVQLEAYNCTFLTNNCTDDGGALNVSAPTGVVVVANCTFSGNTTTDDGGAICGETRYRGPGLYWQPQLLVYNSTIHTNRGDGAIRINRTATEPRYCSIYSSIAAGNKDGTANDDLEGDFVDVDHCLIGEVANSGYTTTGSTTGTSNNVDPKLAPLADNGGPALPDGKALLTYALLPGSPAYNNGSNPLGLATDQRGAGYVREHPAGQPDIGAWEYSPSVLPFSGTLLLVN